ncbi:cell division protein FtsA [Kurthia sibirica]|uniref:Cell division protein FtsA n=1 Tax=Kurthia sibirica TaxID=202750 RepID=A0A2U3AQN4_9BACL|nr:cell division protein FtsA [Kurthia sibirica]PWI26819.1 cell division protein FtsA [Kurthia sibirica]GEK32644.1 cell division protein FtsA [Kurthia sibirica]
MSQAELYVSLDIGSNSVKCIIGEVSDADTFNVIGSGKVKSAGIKKGNIVDIDAAVASIKKAVSRAEAMVGMSVHKVILGIPANQVMLQDVKGVVAINSENREITDDDLYRVIESAEVMSISPDRERVNIVRRQFFVDNLSEIKDPRGMIGIRLEMDGTLITTSKTVLHNVLRCVEKAGLEIQEIYLQSLASGYFVLTDDEKTRGTAFIDIGGESTTISIYKNEHFQHTAMIPLGGDNITKDLSIVLKTPLEQAEQIKLDYGHAFYDHASEDELFTVPVIGSDSKEQFSQRYISEIIGSRLEEIFDLVIDELYNMGVQDLPGGVVLTGGVAKLDGLQELAHEMLQTRVRIYVPNQIGVREPEYTTAVSLIHYAHKESEFFDDFSEEPTLTSPQPQQSKRTEKESKATTANEEPKESVIGKFKGFMNRFIQ